MKTMYRITLLPNADSMADKLAILAARSNGNETPTTLAQLKTVMDGEKIQWPTLYGNTTCELIGDHILHLDRKVADKYETVLILEQVDIMEVPTLSAYEHSGGILNPLNEEILN